MLFYGTICSLLRKHMSVMHMFHVQILLTVDEPAFYGGAPASTSYQAHKGCPTLRFIRSCSSALPVATGEVMEKIYRVPVLQAYAMTEGNEDVKNQASMRQSMNFGWL